MAGRIYLVATPIGNLSDMTFRAIDTLKNVDLIAAEDTRQTLKLLNHFEISKPMISYHRHNEDIKSECLIEKVLAGKNIANPTAIIQSSVMMLRYLGEQEAAAKIENALVKVFEKGENLTGDLGGNATTDEFTNELFKYI